MVSWLVAAYGGSVGLQLGAQATDFVLLLMNERAASSILTSKVKLGPDASAETDVKLRADILSYSRSRGAFAGVSLEGSILGFIWFVLLFATNES